MSQFNRLIIPSKWENYWTKSPQGYSMLEAVINWVSQVNSFIDILEGWEKFMTEFDGEARQMVSELLQQWEADGTLDQIINTTIFNDLNGKIDNVTDLVRFEAVGTDSLEAVGSVYMKNDNNIFGRNPDGSYTNLATVQQNGITQRGDYNNGTVWDIAMNYHSFRSPSNPSYQQIDSEGNAIGSGRTLFHQGNSCGHLILFAAGTKTLTEDVYNTLDNLTTVNGVFPSGAFTGGKYTIPRAGMYLFDTTLKIENAPSAPGMVRIGLEVNGSVSDMGDMFYDPAIYATPFISTNFLYRLSTGDQVRVVAKPVNENIVIGSGSKLYLYQQGDTIQA